LSYISGLCTAAVEQQELHEDTFTLNSNVPCWQNWFLLCDLLSLCNS